MSSEQALGLPCGQSSGGNGRVPATIHNLRSRAACFNHGRIGPRPWLGAAEARQIIAAHGSEVFRQHRQTRTGLRRLFEQLPRLGQVVRDLGPGGHLNHG